MFSAVLIHGNEDLINKELIDNLNEFREAGCELILLQDDRYPVTDIFEFDVVLTHSVDGGAILQTVMLLLTGCCGWILTNIYSPDLQNELLNT